MLREVAARYRGGVAMLVKLSEEEQSFDVLGSAFMCHKAGYLLTCAHIMGLADKLGVWFPQAGLAGFEKLSKDGNALIADARLVQYDAINDVALIKTNLSFGCPVDEYAKDDIPAGATIAYFGYPYSSRGLHVVHTATGVVAATVLSDRSTKQYQLDASVHEGCSGGPVVDVKTGKIFGILSGRFSPTGTTPSAMIGSYALGQESSISYATSISYGRDLMKQEGLIG